MSSYWLCFAVTCLNVLISLGYSVAALVGDARSDVYAQYAASRSVAITGAVVAAAFLHSRDILSTLAFAAAAMQALDAVVGLNTGDRTKVFGPGAVAVLTLAVTIFLIAH